MGLARGSVSSFAFITVLTVGGTLLYMVIMGKLMERSGAAMSYGPQEYDEPKDEDVEHAVAHEQWAD